jgi:hypothetical protein
MNVYFANRQHHILLSSVSEYERECFRLMLLFKGLNKVQMNNSEFYLINIFLWMVNLPDNLTIESSHQTYMYRLHLFIWMYF